MKLRTKTLVKAVRIFFLSLRTKTLVKAVRIFFLSLLTLFFLASLPAPQNPFHIPEVQAQYEGISYDGVTNIATFNQNSTDWPTDLYAADLDGSLELLSSTRRFMVWSRYNDWLNQTQGAHNITAGDLAFVPRGTTTGTTNNYIAIGNLDNTFSTLYFNVTTAGSWGTTTVVRLEYSSGAATFGFQDTTDYDSYFASSGLKIVTVTPKAKDTAWKKATLNGISAYWLRFRATTVNSYVSAALGAQIWLTYPLTVSARIADIDNHDLTVSADITNLFVNGSFDVGSMPIDANGTVAYGTYTEDDTTPPSSIVQTGEFTFNIWQDRWGVIGQYGSHQSDLSWTLLSAVQFGDSATSIDVRWDAASAIAQMFIPDFTHSQSLSVGGIPGIYPTLLVENNTELVFGVLKDLSTKSAQDGVQIASGSDFIVGKAGSTVYIYGSSIKGAASETLIGLFGASRIWASDFYRINLKGENLNVYSLSMQTDTGTAFGSLGTDVFSGSFDKLTVTGSSRVLSFTGFTTSNITINNLYARNSTNLASIWGIGANNPHVFLVDADVDNWTMLIQKDTSRLWRQHSFDLTVTYPNETAFEGANVTIQHYEQGGGTDYIGATDSGGKITAQVLTMGFYDEAGGDTMYDYNPYNLTITADGYQTYTANFTLAAKTAWQIDLQETLEYSPVSRFTYSPSVVYICVPTTFTSSGVDRDGSVSSYSWDFGDSQTASGRTATHTYVHAGTYTVTLTTTDDRGNTDSWSQTISVNVPPDDRSFSSPLLPPELKKPDYYESTITFHVLSCPRMVTYKPFIAETFQTSLEIVNGLNKTEIAQVQYWLATQDGQVLWQQIGNYTLLPLGAQQETLTLPVHNVDAPVFLWIQLVSPVSTTPCYLAIMNQRFETWVTTPALVSLGLCGVIALSGYGVHKKRTSKKRNRDLFRQRKPNLFP